MTSTSARPTPATPLSVPLAPPAPGVVVRCAGWEIGVLREGDVVALRIDTGAADRVVDTTTAAAISSWCAGVGRLLALPPAESWDDVASYRSPWIVAASGSRLLALHAHVERGSVRFAVEAPLGGGTIVSGPAELGEIDELLGALRESR